MWTTKTETVNFLRLTWEKKPVLIRLDSITGVVSDGTSSLIFVTDSDNPFGVDQSVDEIVEIIKKAGEPR